ncbi:MAG: hypothetical protein ACLQUY_28480 [Ktedonobacterales bacterium]
MVLLLLHPLCRTPAKQTDTKAYLWQTHGILEEYAPKHVFEILLEFDHYCKQKHIAKQEPVPLSLFLNYAQWFHTQAVPSSSGTFLRRHGLLLTVVHCALPYGLDVAVRALALALREVSDLRLDIKGRGE